MNCSNDIREHKDAKVLADAYLKHIHAWSVYRRANDDNYEWEKHKGFWAHFTKSGRAERTRRNKSAANVQKAVWIVDHALENAACQYASVKTNPEKGK